MSMKRKKMAGGKKVDIEGIESPCSVWSCFKCDDLLDFVDVRLAVCVIIIVITK